VSFAAEAERLGVHVSAGERLARHTTFKIGGPADLFAAATTLEQLEGLARLAAEDALPVTVLGGGSNVLIADAGIRGLVIANQTRDTRTEAAGAEAGVLIAESGVAMAGLARWAMRRGMSGLEWAVSVPGTVGGAVIGNAGAHGSDTAANLAWVMVYRPGSGPEVWTRAELRYAYRSSALKQQLLDGGAAAPVVLAAAFDMASGDPEEMAGRADDYLARRRATQPVEPSAGSIFRNPPGEYAGRLVETVGLKGHRIGGAQVSPRHANFIINAGEATAADVVALLNLMRRRVYEASGHALIPEILFLGDWNGDSLCGL
jgi:UDP-N-acetylmuramate dehydrogenase